jgi:hypothetical protein
VSKCANGLERGKGAIKWVSKHRLISVVNDVKLPFWRSNEEMTFIVKKAVQDYAKKNNLQVSGDFYGALDSKIEKILSHAAKRTGSNKRKTLKAYDL